MKLAIIGSRTFDNYAMVKAEIDKLSDISLIVSGGAKGADSLGERYAKEKGIPTKIFLPNWNLFGKQAGFLRNIDIINNCDMVVAFWDGKSRGTKHSIDLAEKAGKKVIIVKGA